MMNEKDPHEFPNQFREAFDATVQSIVVFTIADLRHLA
jgi:hypothetical protein